MEEKNIKDTEIRRLEFISKALLILFIFFVFYVSFFRPGTEILCFGKQINIFLLLSPLIVAVILEIIAISIRRKHQLPTKDSLKRFLKFLIYSLIASLIISFILAAPVGHRGRAIDARKVSALAQIRIVQEKFYSDNGRYAASLKELEETGYFPGVLDEAKRFNIFFEKSKNSDSWKAYAYIREYRHEICSGIKPPKDIYICDNTGCREGAIKY